MPSSCFSSITRLRHGCCCSRTSVSSGSGTARRGPIPPAAFTVRVEGSGEAIQVADEEWTCGSDSTKASFQLGTSPAVEPVHVKLTQKTKRRAATATATAAAAGSAAAPAQVFLTALANVDDMDMLADSRAWLDGTPLRPGVQYVLGNGQRVEIGAASGAGAGAAAFVVEFSETSGRDPLVEMMMQGMAGGGGAGDKLRDALE